MSDGVDVSLNSSNISGQNVNNPSCDFVQAYKMYIWFIFFSSEEVERDKEKIEYWTISIVLKSNWWVKILSSRLIGSLPALELI